MKTNLQSPSQDNAGGIASVSVLGARITWVLLGPISLALLVVGIVQRGNGWLTGLDGLFGLVVGLMILGRWVEQRSGAATTLTGEPATLQQCKRYTVILLVVAAVSWITANILGNHILR